MSQSRIRNFCVIAHIDHGKSTLCDRLLELTGTVTKRDMQEQMLDSNPIERERGITIKLAPVRMTYRARMTNDKFQMTNKNIFEIGNLTFDISDSEFILNLIDTPGHVDFSYEVSRSLAACEGALLVVDATQGVQAQTIANLAAARKAGLTIIPAINKIDMPHARISECVNELCGMGFKKEEMLQISAKTGQNVERVLDAIIEGIPPPHGEPAEPLRALVFSSHYDPHKGVVVFVRVVDGEISLEGSHPSRLRFLASGSEATPIEVGYFNPQMLPSDGLRTGEVGYIATGLKDIRLAKVGDTVTFQPIHPFTHSPVTPLPGYHEPKPMVFLGLFPIDASEYQGSREAMEKLRLSDSAFTFRPISSAALGNGFHCGFLGLLHAEIVAERLSREFDLNMIATAPSVEYQISLKRSHLARQGETFQVIQSATEFPDPSVIEEVKEPIMQVKIFTPKKYIGAVMQLAQEKRGEYVDMKYFNNAPQPPLSQRGGEGELSSLVELTYLMPLADMIIDFFDRLKSVSEGYASLDYEFFEFQAVDVVKIDILVNHEKVDALSLLSVEDQAQRRGREIVERLAEVIPRQQFTIPLQAAIGGHIIARADVKAFRKDVTQKLYGGDRTRKDKLLKKQKKGKERMKMVGNVQIPQTAFFEVLKRT
ncbi:elongation factor 4 [Candidatus Gottesmanbacteria bacterium]|nr:elongation factor 4 [Candidatus Gottesmanbacteria bacterium]